MDRFEPRRTVRAAFLAPLTEVAYMTQHIAQERLPAISENPRHAADAYARRQEKPGSTERSPSGLSVRVTR